MRIVNLSSLHDDDVRKLVEAGARGSSVTGVVTVVQECQSSHRYRGRAYGSVRVPASYRRWVRPGEQLIVVEVSLDARAFPAWNQSSSCRYENTGYARLADVPEETYRADHAMRRSLATRPGDRWFSGYRTHHHPARGEVRVDRRVCRVHPYGGLSSPRIDYADWREAMVAVTAHELRHTLQFATGARASEVDCERWALAVLEQYRAGRG